MRIQVTISDQLRAIARRDWRQTLEGVKQPDALDFDGQSACDRLDAIMEWTRSNPVAQALQRLTEHQWSVCNQFATIPTSISRAGQVRIGIPEEVGAWLDRFDHSPRPIEIIEFEIDYDCSRAPREQVHTMKIVEDEDE